MTKKEDIIVSARELFTKYGYRKVSLLDIANKSGVTKKTIYSYFKDKDDLFCYFIKEELENMKKNIDGKLNSAMSFPEIVSTNVHDMLEFRKNSLLISTISEEVKLGKTKESKSFLKLYDDGIIKYIEEKIEKGIVEHHIKKCNAHLTAFIIYKVYIAVMFEYEGELDEEKITKEITTILTDGLLNKN